jgi:meso-butanediol dehydrogenase / (S,S)-butanediol dehydrogenase / diacetyl reductase
MGTMLNRVRGPLLEGSVAVITGGASGIGKACAVAMAGEGARVAILDSNEELGRGVADELTGQGAEASFFPVDVACEGPVRDAVENVIARFGKIDILHNNAGIAMRHRVHEQPTDGWQRCVEVNLNGVFFCSKYVIPHMLERGGSIINTSSVTGITGVRNRSAYTATKGALVALTRNMALDYARYGIRVNSVCPGFTRTPLAEALLRDPKRERRLVNMHPLGRLGEPEDIANAVVFLASKLASWITGQALAVDGGFSAGPFGDI